MPNKFHHVKSAQLDPARSHECHWPGCHLQVPAAQWGCKAHWMSLPKIIRDRIWAAYTLGQEDDHSLVSEEYLDAASQAQRWITAYKAAASAPRP
jgi:hypothetical protein